MIIEHRTYTLPHGGMDAISRATANWRCRCRCATWAVCWDSSSATSARSIRCCTSGPTTAWPTAKPRALEADPAWQEFKRGNRGTFVAQQVSIWRAASFSQKRV